MENLIWIMLLVIALLIVDIVMLRQRLYRLQEQLNEALKSQANLKQQVIKLADNVKRIVDIVHGHIINNDGK